MFYWQHLLRCGREAVQVTHELDIITTEYGEDSKAMTGDLVSFSVYLSSNLYVVSFVIKGRGWG